MLLTNLFILSGILLAALILLGKCFIFKLNDNMLVSQYVALIAAIIGLYSALALGIAIVNPILKYRLLMIFFAFSPFIIGQLVTFKTEKIFTGCQIALALVSIFICKLYF